MDLCGRLEKWTTKASLGKEEAEVGILIANGS